AHVHEHEAPGAVGVLGHARLEAGLAEQRGLLVAGYPADGRPGQRPSGDAPGAEPEATAGGQDLGQRIERHPHGLAQLRVPTPAAYVVEQSAAGVGGIGGVHTVAGASSSEGTSSASVPSTADQISSGSCSTHPGRGKCWANSRYAHPRGVPWWSTARLRTPVVPASMAMTTGIRRR